MLVAHKIALDPNMAQRQYFARAARTARIACGETRSGVARKSRMKRASTKQEEKIVNCGLGVNARTGGPAT
jgi:hypothetical protein